MDRPQRAQQYSSTANGERSNQVRLRPWREHWTEHKRQHKGLHWEQVRVVVVVYMTTNTQGPGLSENPNPNISTTYSRDELNNPSFSLFWKVLFKPFTFPQSDADEFQHHGAVHSSLPHCSQLSSPLHWTIIIYPLKATSYPPKAPQYCDWICHHASHFIQASSITKFTLQSFSRHSYPERLTWAIRVKCIAQGHIGRFFHLVGSGIRTSALSVTGPTLLTDTLPASPDTR